MSQPGGSAAINGFLYQILANLWQISEIKLSDVSLSNEAIQSARLILEPRGGGGDAQYEIGNIRIVEQYKTRASDRKWSLSEVIQDIFPDLFRAVNIDNLHKTCQYRFVTDGQRGRWNHFERFLQNFITPTIPETPLEVLDNTISYSFFNKKPCTDRELFLHIAASVKAKGDTTEEVTHYRKLWHLLAGFGIKDEVSASTFKRGIDEFLLQVVDVREAIEGKRRELCAIIMELAAEGHAVCTPESILQRAHLNATPLSNLSILKQNLWEKMEDKFERKGYDPKLDIRSAPSWPEESSILFLAGESGQGKTWQLFNLANELQNTGHSVIIVSSYGDVDKLLQNVSNSIWLDSLSHDHPIPLSRLTARYQEVHLLPDTPWLTICLDNVQDLGELRRLVEQPWKRWKIGLILTAPLEYGKPITNFLQNEITLIEVKDFTLTETLAFLERHGYEWGNVPQDVRRIIQRPFLAGLYCDIAADADWTPHNEYELYAKYWETIASKDKQIEHPDDRNIFLRLVGSLLEQDARYPWNYSQREQVGLHEDALLRLEKVGLLRRVGRGDVEVWHDRVLNWAVAEWLVEQRRTDCLQFSELQDILSHMLGYENNFAGRRLGYVPMDYPWLACDPVNDIQDDVPDLLQALERHPGAGGYPEGFYHKLVPTLGQRILPALVERLKASIPSSERFNLVPGFIAQAMIKIGEQFPEQVKRKAIEFIERSPRDEQETGLKILKEFPDPGALDKLWDIHKLDFDALKEPRRQGDYWNHKLSFPALKACVQLAPQWLVNKIRKAEPGIEPVCQLGWLLFNLSDWSTAKEIWGKNKQLLFEKVQDDDPSSLIRCIGRFKDDGELPRLEFWLDCEADRAHMVAFSELCHLDPNKAISSIKRLGGSDLYWCRAWWVPELFLRKPQMARQELLTIAQTQNNGCLYLQSIYCNHENLIDVNTLDFFLDRLETALSEQTGHLVAQDDPPPWLWRSLQFISQIHNLELVRAVEKRADTPLESLISRLAQSRLSTSYPEGDKTFKFSYNVLCKICGQGLTDLLNRELASKHFDIRGYGIGNAIRRPDERTCSLLRELIHSEELFGEPPQPAEQEEAVSVLAALGEYDAVVEAIRRWGIALSRSLFSFWSPDAPMPLARLKKIVEIVFKENAAAMLTVPNVADARSHSELIPLLQTVLRECPPESQITRFTIELLIKLEDRSDEFIEFLRQFLKIKEFDFSTTNYLLYIGEENPLAFDVLVEHLEQTRSHNDNKWWDFAFALVHQEAIREKVAHILSEKEKSDDVLTFIGWPLEILDQLDIENTYEKVVEAAFTNNTMFPYSVTSAIRGLGKIDPERAVHAGKLALKRLRNVDSRLPKALVAFSETRAIALLCEHMSSEERASIRWGIGRALRLVKNRKTLERQLRKMLSQPESIVRKAAVEIIGWQLPGFLSKELKNLALIDFDYDISQKALEAVHRQTEQQWTQELMQEFRKAPSCRRWSLLDSIIELGDPFILQERADPLWIGQILDKSPSQYWNYALRQLKTRKNTIERKAKK